jgi:phage protein D/phage baseplate assembly protein gpV
MTALETVARLSIELDGAPLDERGAAALSQVSVFQRLSLPSLCELTFVDTVDGGMLASRIATGTPLRVSTEQGGQLLFRGEVTALRHHYGPAREHEVRLRAFDPLHRLRKRQPVRALVQLNLRDLARELVADLGLEVHMDDAGPVWPRIMQWRQSDLELLTEVSARCGQYFVVRGDTLHFFTLEGYGHEVDLELGRTLLEARFDASTEPACRTVSVRAWNPWTASPHEAKAESARVGRSSEMDPSPDSVGSPGHRILVDEAAHSDAHAGVLAQAELDRRVSGEVTVEGVAVGNGLMHAGVPVFCRGVAGPFEGRYVLTGVTHTVDRESGFRSSFDTNVPHTPPRPRGCVATLGIVLESNDPDKLGRVRVALPNYCDLETDWLEVLAPGGGNGKGLVTVPDTGDRVLLLLPREDPAQAVVLGGLFAADGPPDECVRDRRVWRYTFVTRGGQRLYLEEEHKTVRMENGTGGYLEIAPGSARIANSAGSYVELTRERVRMHAETDLEIEAPGKSLIFRGAKVDFQTG